MTAERLEGDEAAGAGLLPGGERRRITALRFVGGVVSMVVGALLLRMAVLRLVKGVAALFGAAAALVWGLTLLGGGGWSVVGRWRHRRRFQSPQDDDPAD